MLGISKYISPVLDLFYPEICPGCGGKLNDEVLCFSCNVSLTRISMDVTNVHPAFERMQSRFDFENGFAAFYMLKESIIAEIMHKIKYAYKEKLGLEVGKMMAETLASHWTSADFDAIVSVPIYKRKMEKRGYNQSELLARSIAEHFQVAYNPDTLLKIKNTSSQTTKTRLERIHNIDSSFQLDAQHQLDGAHILLVDDVLTTGSTLEACAQVLTTIPNVRISFAVLVLADL